MTPSSESTNSAATLPTDSLPFFVFGTLTNDLKAAALGGMAGIVAYFIDQLVDLGWLGLALFSVGSLSFYWGLLQLGRLYGLSWVRRGAMLLMLAIVAGWVPLFTGNGLGSVADGLAALLSAVGTVVAFVDVWALRTEVDRRLVVAVVIGHVAAVFILTLRLTSQSVFQFLEATNVGLLAWLFYEIVRQLTPPQPTDPATTQHP